MNPSVISEAAFITDVRRLTELNTSTPDGVRRAMAYASSALGQVGIPSEIHSFDAGPVLTAEVGPATGPLLIWLCRADVGEAADPSQGRAYRRERRLIGNGVYGAHAVTACMLHALPHVREHGRVRVRLVMVSDHEQPPPHTISDYARGVGQPPNFCIAGGPTNLTVGNAAVGLITLRGTIRATEDHPISTESNPTLEAIRLFQTIKTLSISGALAVESLQDVVVDLSYLHGVQLPGDICEFGVTVRFAPGISAEKVHREIEAIVRQHAAPLRSRPDPLELEVEVAQPIPPVQLGPNHPYVDLLVSAVRPYHTAGDLLTISQAASDLALAGWPGVQFGLRGGVNRVSGQWLDLDSVVPYAEALIDFVRRLGTSQVRS
jgi:acetylornithine deacetylase/succinyl-diaminopimelate desuccinylase-like protein